MQETSPPRARRLVIGMCLAALALSVTGAMAELTLGREAYARGDFATAWRELEPVAQEGVDEAEYLIGRMLARGEGRAADPKRAAEWYRRAAQHGNPQAQNNLGLLYEEGTGVPQDASVAATWYRRAAKTGLAVAAFNLARLLESGVEGTDGVDEAGRWYRRAAARGHAGAAEWIARQATPRVASPEPGEAPPPPLTPEAEAAPAGAPEVAAAPSAPRRPDAPQADLDAWNRGDWSSARESLSAAAASGDPEAAYRLGVLADQGLGGPRDLGAAERWFRTAAKRNHGRAMYELAFLELRGRTAAGKKDPLAARFWFTLAAERGAGDAAAWVAKIDNEELTPEEIESVEARARAWRPGDPPSTK